MEEFSLLRELQEIEATGGNQSQSRNDMGIAAQRFEAYLKLLRTGGRYSKGLPQGHNDESVSKPHR
jgi:hypothetical protein